MGGIGGDGVAMQLCRDAGQGRGRGRGGRVSAAGWMNGDPAPPPGWRCPIVNEGSAPRRAPVAADVKARSEEMK